jgi:hypothetical protein
MIVPKQLRYVYLGGPFVFYAEAEAYSQGYINARKNAKLEDRNIKVCSLQNIRHDGYYSPAKYPREGFYVVNEIQLTPDEMKKKEAEFQQKKFEEAKKKVETSKQELQKIQKEAAKKRNSPTAIAACNHVSDVVEFAKKQLADFTAKKKVNEYGAGSGMMSDK